VPPATTHPPPCAQVLSAVCRDYRCQPAARLLQEAARRLTAARPLIHAALLMDIELLLL